MKYDQNIIIMAKRDDPFARVSKAMLDDDRLSWQAKGVLSYLLGKPPGWKLRVSNLHDRSTNGMHTVKSALKQLRAVGYASLAQVREGSHIKEWVWKVSDTPIFRSLEVENELLDNQLVENRPISKKDT